MNVTMKLEKNFPSPKLNWLQEKLQTEFNPLAPEFSFTF
jgi:hypothetical protein